jgi:hypothetical protein
MALGSIRDSTVTPYSRPFPTFMAAIFSVSRLAKSPMIDRCTKMRFAHSRVLHDRGGDPRRINAGHDAEAMQKMRLEATRLTDRDREHLAKIVCAGKAAGSSIDPDDETPAGYRYCRGDLHWYYEMLSEMVDDALQDAWGPKSRGD